MGFDMLAFWALSFLVAGALQLLTGVGEITGGIVAAVVAAVLVLALPRQNSGRKLPLVVSLALLATGGAMLAAAGLRQMGPH